MFCIGGNVVGFVARYGRHGNRTRADGFMSRWRLKVATKLGESMKRWLVEFCCLYNVQGPGRALFSPQFRIKPSDGGA